MYDDLVERLRYCAVSDNQCFECKYRGGSPDGSKMCLDLLMEEAANAIEERDMAALTIQHEMMAEAESHIALVERLNKQIEELSKLADAIPHVCECCIGCEVESGGCDRGFVLSPKRAREYLSKRRWIPVMEEQDGKV